MPAFRMVSNPVLIAETAHIVTLAAATSLAYYNAVPTCESALMACSRQLNKHADLSQHPCSIQLTFGIR